MGVVVVWVRGQIYFGQVVFEFCGIIVWFVRQSLKLGLSQQKGSGWVQRFKKLQIKGRWFRNGVLFGVCEFYLLEQVQGFKRKMQFINFLKLCVKVCGYMFCLCIFSGRQFMIFIRFLRGLGKIEVRGGLRMAV